MLNPNNFETSMGIDINNFNLLHPREAEKVIDVREGPNHTLIFTTNDGREIVWNCFTNRIESPAKSDSKIIDIYQIEDTDWNKIFGKKLKKKMREVGMTQSTLASLTNIAPASISQYCNGDTMPTAIKLVKIARALKCNVDELINF